MHMYSNKVYMYLSQCLIAFRQTFWTFGSLEVAPTILNPKNVYIRIMKIEIIYCNMLNVVFKYKFIFKLLYRGLLYLDSPYIQ